MNLNFYFNFNFELNSFSVSFLFPARALVSSPGRSSTRRRAPNRCPPLSCPHRCRPRAPARECAVLTGPPPPPSICCHAAHTYRTPLSLHPGCRPPSPLEGDGAPTACSLFHAIPHRPEHPTSFSTAYDSASSAPATGDPFSAPVSVQAPPPSAIIGEYGRAPSLLSNGSMPHTPSLVCSCRSTLGLLPTTE
jgi:hypothetical protein